MLLEYRQTEARLKRENFKATVCDCFYYFSILFKVSLAAVQKYSRLYVLELNSLFKPVREFQICLISTFCSFVFIVIC